MISVLLNGMKFLVPTTLRLKVAFLLCTPTALRARSTTPVASTQHVYTPFEVHRRNSTRFIRFAVKRHANQLSLCDGL